MNPIVIGFIIAGLLYLMPDEPEKPKKSKGGGNTDEKEDHHSSIGGNGGEPVDDGQTVHGNRGVNLAEVQKLLSEEMGGLKNVFKTELDSIRSQFADNRNRQPNPIKGDGQTESLKAKKKAEGEK